MILVTGGTGLVGSHLLYHLTQKNDAIRAIYRTKESIAKTKEVFGFYSENNSELFNKIEWMQADITDVPAMIPVFKDISVVYHCAALVSFKAKDYREMRKVNIHGTAIIVNLSIDAGVKKLCYVSSIAAISEKLNKSFIDEENEWNKEDDNSGYAITKYGAEIEVWRASQEGVEVVVVNPGVILGSGFWMSGSSKMFTQVYEGFKYFTNGVTGFVGVKDVVKAMIQLTESTIKNERFILVSENKSFKKVLFSIAASLEKTPPSINIKPWQTAVFWRIEWLLSLFGKTPSISKHGARSLHSKTYYKADKIKERLPFTFDPIDVVIAEVSDVFLEQRSLDRP